MQRDGPVRSAARRSGQRCRMPLQVGRFRLVYLQIEVKILVSGAENGTE